MSEFTCSRCDICTINNHLPLLGDGNPNANIMFINKNPTALEIKNNIPLISKDGMLLQEYFDLFNFTRDLIYITNAVKCKTPGHRYPTDVEIAHCYSYLDDEIKTINPKIIVLMGIVPIRSYFKLAFSNSIFDVDAVSSKYMIHNNRIIVFMPHPSFAINSVFVRQAIFNTFNTILDLYRVINPGHTTNINTI